MHIDIDIQDYKGEPLTFPFHQDAKYSSDEKLNKLMGGISSLVKEVLEMQPLSVRVEIHCKPHA